MTTKANEQPSSGAAPKRPQARGVKRARMLLDVATELFISKGIDETTIDDIVGKAGIAKGTFYHHYDSKATLLLAIHDAVMEDFEDYVAAALSKCPPDDLLARLDAWLKATYEAYVQMLPSQDIAFSSEGFRWSPRGNKHFEDLVQLIHEGVKKELWNVKDPYKAAIFIERGMIGVIDDRAVMGKDLKGGLRELVELARRVLVQ
ncbi:TetR/AcrR family transcriptional regulator [Pseudomonas sp. S75]|uniref:TetR/AcrR family transcriptional regulator n=1 Tax=unclassified Pseudomonas TaxID=196821 RepID=UPI001907E41F|nr:MULTISPECIES: TetR/AcrR family transcriptional regulator [unclassified Pseudomonas]MBJ9974135.1 TetR/AcrR family transcriptional regulator [Pseudomonas sp. S30]MBK0151935.1 TetR/AcrR family transcriptional regulator [Pseudomonas sp. S75]